MAFNNEPTTLKQLYDIKTASCKDPNLCISDQRQSRINAPPLPTAEPVSSETITRSFRESTSSNSEPVNQYACTSRAIKVTSGGGNPLRTLGSNPTTKRFSNIYRQTDLPAPTVAEANNFGSLQRQRKQSVACFADGNRGRNRFPGRHTENAELRKHSRSSAFDSLLTNSETTQQFDILFRLICLQVIQETSSTAYHSQKTSSRRVVFRIASKMVCQNVNLIGEAGNLNRRRPGIVVPSTIFTTYFSFDFRRNRHVFLFARRASLAVCGGDDRMPQRQPKP